MTVDQPVGSPSARMAWGSDAIAELLRRLDLAYISLNPGASYRGLHDSLVNYLSNRDPEILLALHEEHAVAIAHGYAKVTERPMAVVVHSNVGLMHATMAIFNAWCDRVPILILGGTGPVDAARRRPWIDWIHTMQDPGALIRHYTKWDDQPASIPAALESLLRANLLMRTPPRAPVYVSLDAALQEAVLEAPVTMPDIARFQPGHPAQAAQEALTAAAGLLGGAQRPLILAGRVSRSKDDWARRVALAETLGARVLTDLKVGAAFPTTHPLHASVPGYFLAEDARALAREADAILSLDWLDLAGTLTQIWGDAQVTAKIIHCSVDRYVHNGWSMDYQALPPVDLPILAEPDVAVPPLLALIEATRGSKVSDATNRPPSHAERPPWHRSASGSIGVRDIAGALAEVAGDRPICLIRLPLGWPGDAWAFRSPLDYLGADGGAGVGAGPGMAVGAALALRGTGRLPVAILGDGDYLMGVSGLWTAAHYRIPLLIIVANNRSYYNDELHQERVARQRGRPIENKWIGQRIDDPAIDLASMARAQGLAGSGPIVDLAELPKALAEAVATVDGGQPFVLDVAVTPGYDSGITWSTGPRR